MEIKTDLFLGDSREILKKLPDNSVDLIITSPPYADQLKALMGGSILANMWTNSSFRVLFLTKQTKLQYEL